MGMLDLFREWQRKVDNRFRARRRRGLEHPEQLELRRMLSAVVIGTTLRVDADPNPQNQITITQDSNNVTVIENGIKTFDAASMMIDPTMINAINVFGNAGDDSVTITSIFKTTALTVDGGGGNNTLTALQPPFDPNAPLLLPNIPPVSNWLISSPNSGSWNGNAFGNIQNLVGGVGNDNFLFAPSGIVSGSIDGGGGVDSLNYSGLTNGIIVDLTSNSATAIGAGFTNISDFVGSSDNTDLLLGPNTANQWQITGANTGSINQHQFYYSFENLQGGVANDSFAFIPGGFESGNIGGGGGFNTLDYSGMTSGVSTSLQFSSSTGIGGTFAQIASVIGSGTGTDTLLGSNENTNWTISGPNAGSVQTQSFQINFAGYENLYGGSSYDTFRFVPSGFVSGKLNGGTGQNGIDYSQLTTGIVFNLQTRAATAIGGGFQNIQSVVGSSGSSDASNDTLIGADSNTSWNITGPNSGSLNGNFYFSSMENLAGGLANDSFNFLGGFVSGTIRGGKGNNTLNYSSGFGPSAVDLQRSAATGVGGGFGQIQNYIGKDSLDPGNFDTLIGANATNTWNISGKNSGNVNGNFNFIGIENLTGGTGVDVFRLAAGSFVTGTVSGSSNNTGGDWLDYSAFTTQVTVNLAAGTATGIGNLLNMQNVHGGDGVNTLAGNSQGNILVGGLSNDTITGGTGRNLLIGGAGSDVVTGNNSDDIVISSYTSYDNNLAALASIFAEWRSPLTFDQRIAHLRNGGGLNGTNVLVADSTVFNDVVPDTISGGGGRNWLWGQPAEIQNAKPTDVIDTPINNPPVLTGLTSLVYTANQGGVPINPIINVTDVDSRTLASATVKIAANTYNSSQDSLGFIPSTVTGNILGSFNATTGTLTLTSAFATATVAQFQAALRSVTYSNSSGNPSTATRTIVFQAYDGVAYSNTLSTPVDFNFSPSLSGTSTISYTAGQAPTVINPNISVTDPNSLYLSYATVSLSNIFFAPEDVLSFVGQLQ